MNAINERHQQMSYMLRKFFTLPKPVADECSVYIKVTVGYWTLVDLLVEGAGYVDREGIRYIPVLRGKDNRGLQDICDPPEPGEESAGPVFLGKTGRFCLSYRAWKKNYYVLIKEILE